MRERERQRKRQRETERQRDDDTGSHIDPCGRLHSEVTLKTAALGQVGLAVPAGGGGASTHTYLDTPLFYFDLCCETCGLLVLVFFFLAIRKENLFFSRDAVEENGLMSFP